MGLEGRWGLLQDLVVVLLRLVLLLLLLGRRRQRPISHRLPSLLSS